MDTNNGFILKLFSKFLLLIVRQRRSELHAILNRTTESVSKSVTETVGDLFGILKQKFHGAVPKGITFALLNHVIEKCVFVKTSIMLNQTMHVRIKFLRSKMLKMQKRILN